jgi:hypothetical protein
MAGEPNTVEELVARIDAAWEALDAQIAGYGDRLMTGPVDHAGWTIRDHLAHLVAWEASVVGILRDGQTQDVTMGVDRVLWEAGDLDAVNEQIRQRTADQSLAEVMADLRATHRELLAVLDTVTIGRLGERWADAVGDASRAPSLMQKVLGNTVEHYPEHGEWIAGIAAGSGAKETA